MGKKQKSTGSLRGFILLITLIVIALFLYQNRNGNVTVDGKLHELTEKAKSAVTNANTSANVNPSPGKLEIPVSIRKREEIVLRRTAFTLSYNNAYKTPNWVAWELTRAETQGSESRKSKFEPDPDLPEPRAEHSDYTRSGYDRGHMAPAADMKWSDKAMEESFLLTNICPQSPGLNRGRWKELEEQVREWARRDSALLIVCGPIVDTSKKTIGQHQIVVPDRYFKVVAAPYLDTPRGIAFLFDNSNDQPSMKALAIPIDSVEKITGIDFFYLLPDSIETRIESNISPELWNLN